MQLIDCRCRIEQAREVLGMWLENSTEVGTNSVEQTMICALITLLDKVPESLREIDNSQE